jgi:hypothetical protein
MTYRTRLRPQIALQVTYQYSSFTHVYSREQMAKPKLTKLELQIMDTPWTRGTTSIREIQETFPEKDRPAYTTIQDNRLSLGREKGCAPPLQESR